MPRAKSFDGTPAVGALFTYGTSGIGTHFCTASVVDSPAGDLILTAAHCVSPRKGAFVFIPGYHDGKAPHGVWRVGRVIVDKNWKSSASPDDDFAFLIVQRIGSKGGTRLEQLTGGERIGVDEPDRQMVRVVGYPDGKQLPIRCQNRAFGFSRTQLEFDCDGYTGGTSGSPLIAHPNSKSGLGTVIGVIGGYEYGGDTPEVSYAAKFRGNLAGLYASAIKAAAAAK